MPRDNPSTVDATRSVTFLQLLRMAHLSEGICAKLAIMAGRNPIKTGLQNKGGSGFDIHD
jgi:hypothetical protein